MELRHLRYFVAVAREGSVTGAARRLHIQQPPLSAQVRDLERELGFDLFRRLPRGVELTDAGKVFLDEAEAVLAAVDRGKQRAARAARGAAGTLALGFTSSAAAHRLAPELIRRYRAAEPGIELRIEEGNAAALTRAVAARRLDAAFIRAPVSRESGLAFHAIAEEHLLVAMPARHPLAAAAARRANPRVALRDLRDEGFILVRRPGAPGMYADLIEACHGLGFAPRVVAEVEQMLTNITLVAAGLGVSVVPASMREFHRDDVVYAEPVDAPTLRAPLSLVTRMDAPSPALERFLRAALAVRDARLKTRARKPTAASPGRARGTRRAARGA